MEIEMLLYKRQKGTITTEDYIAWSNTMIAQENETASLQIMSAFTTKANLFEIEAYFQRAMHEIGLEISTIEPNSSEAIQLLAKDILRKACDEEIIQLADEIFHIVVELNYPDEYMGWYEISEMKDRLAYDQVPPFFSQHEMIQKIKGAARLVLASEGTI